MRALVRILLIVLLASCFGGRGVRKAEVISVDKGHVLVRLTGNIMLDGGCSGDRPLWALEMRTDSGWVERVPFSGAQQLCGPGSWRWRKREVLIPLKEEVVYGTNTTDHVLAPGAYRLMFMGSGGKRKATRAFKL